MTLLWRCGIGYRIFVSATLAKLPQTGEVVIFTYFSVKGGWHEPVRLAAREEQEMFEKLVNGVGPKGALGFLSVLNPPKL